MMVLIVGLLLRCCMGEQSSPQRGWRGLRFLQYNPLSFNSVDRQEDLANECSNFDIVALCGTGSRSWDGKVGKKHVDGRLHFAGFGGGHFTNRCVVCSIVCGNIAKVSCYAVG